jgi:1L-myo-inositol 1-phosphate cytidylyltransferase / CDP-L-myo-inositol myo-inositolphosphotransferase
MALIRPRALGMAARAHSQGSVDRSSTDRSLPRVGVILAAGRSARLSRLTGGGSKALSRLGGKTLIERAVQTLLAGGCERVAVVAGYEAAQVEAAVAGLSDVSVVRAADWELGNGASLASSGLAVAGESLFAVLCADHVFADGAVGALLGAGEPAVLFDPRPDQDSWAEGTRVLVEEGRAVAFDKRLDEPAIDCGAFTLGPEIFQSQKLAAAEGDHSLAGAVTRFAQVHPIRAVPLPHEAWWQDVDTPADLARARRLVRGSLGKETDGPISRHLNRPISTRITMALAPLRIPPDLLSALFFLVGMWAAWSLSAGQAVMGGLLVQAASILDGVDGETARLLGVATKRGATLDALADRMVDAAVVAGVALWQWNDPSRLFRVLIITMAAVGWGSITVIANERWHAISTFKQPPSIERRLGSLLGGRDGRLFVMALFSVFGRPELALAGAGVSWSATLLIRAVLRVIPGRRTSGAAGTETPLPRDIGQATQGDLEEVG